MVAAAMAQIEAPVLQLNVCAHCEVQRFSEVEIR